MTQTEQTQEQIERLENQYNEYGRDIPDSRWGEEQEAELGRIGADLRAAYDAAGTDDLDRVVL